jgi:hypothetical protein
MSKWVMCLPPGEGINDILKAPCDVLVVPTALNTEYRGAGPCSNCRAGCPMCYREALDTLSSAKTI